MGLEQGSNSSEDRVLEGRELLSTKTQLQDLMREALATLPSATKAAFEALWEGRDRFIFEHSGDVYNVQITALQTSRGERIGTEYHVSRYRRAARGEPSVYGLGDLRGEFRSSVHFTTHLVSPEEVRRGNSFRGPRPAFGFKSDDLLIPHYPGAKVGDPVFNTERAAQRIRQFVEDLKSQDSV